MQAQVSCSTSAEPLLLPLLPLLLSPPSRSPSSLSFLLLPLFPLLPLLPAPPLSSDGLGRTGAFCTLYTVLERVKAEQVVDVFQAVKTIRIQRAGMLESLVCVQ